MPTYDYKCLTDDIVFEKNVSIDERDGNIQCPVCDLYFTQRLISFKGLTWSPTRNGGHS